MEMQDILPRQVVGLDLSASNSFSGVVSTLIPLTTLCGFMLLCFFTLRWRAKPLYRPRVHLGLQHPTAPGSFVRKILSREVDYPVLKDQSLDAFLFLRFIRWLVGLALYGCAITWPVLLPINATGGGRTSQFDTLAITNVRVASRLYAHVVTACCYYGYVLFSVYRETRYCIRLRQVYLLRHGNRSPRVYRSMLYGQVSAQDASGFLKDLQGVSEVTPVTDTRELEKTLLLRDKLVSSLETNLVRLSNIATRYAVDPRFAHIEPHRLVESAEQQSTRLTMPGRYLPRRLILKDAIIQTIEELKVVQQVIRRLRHASSSKRLRVAFVECESMMATELLSRAIFSHIPHRMVRLAARPKPSEVIWPLLGISGWQRRIRSWLSTALVVLLLLAWSPIATSVGVLSNINYLQSSTPFEWVGSIPNRYVGILTGLVPSTALTLVLVVMPIILRFIAKRSGVATMQQAELLVQRWFFAFQIIQVFLLVTIGSSASAVFDRIKISPVSISVFLASNLPKASNFYITYFITYGLASSASTLLNSGALLAYLFVTSFWDDTPRKRTSRLTRLPEMDWGTTYPKFSMLAIIFLTYAILCPLILGFAAFALVLLYLAYRYNVRSVLDCTTRLTDGEYYLRALQQVTVGIYLGLSCLLGLFVIRSFDSLSSIGPTTLVAVATLCAAIGHRYMLRSLLPLSRRLPVDYIKRAQQTPLNSAFAPELHALELELAPFLDLTTTAESTNKHPSMSQPDPVLQLVSDRVGTTAIWGARIKEAIDWYDRGAWWTDSGTLRTTSEDQYDEDSPHRTMEEGNC